MNQRYHLHVLQGYRRVLIQRYRLLVHGKAIDR